MASGLLPALALLLAAPLRAAQAPPAEAVNFAIDSGMDFLLRSQNRDGSWGLEVPRWKPHDEHRNGPTSLALYTLLRCGLRPDHPAARRAIAFLMGEVPEHTYALGIELMALGAAGDPGLADHIETLADRLVDLLGREGWDYGPPKIGMKRPDLSNTQVAALGLRAARQAGVGLRSSTWDTLARIALAYQESPEVVPGGLGGKERRLRAGFRYMPDGEVVSGSMTTAGLTLLGIAAEAEPALRERHAEEIAQGLAWLETHFSVEENPGGSGQWLYYYLYGLERVGALLDIDRVGDHDWYAEGATVLVRQQWRDGSWRFSGGQGRLSPPLETSSTCFALLFLRRATLSHMGGLPLGFRAQEGEDSDVWVRLDPDRAWTFWISGFSRAVRRRLTDEEVSFAVEEVEWSIDGTSIATVPGEPGAPWSDQRFPARWKAPDGSPHTLECRVRVRPLRPDGVAEDLRSRPLTAASSAVLEAWQMEYATDAARNLLLRNRVKVEVSSEERFNGGKDLAVDGLQGSAWIPAGGDAAPWIRIEPSKAIRAREIWISTTPANPAAGQRYGRLAAVELILNGDRESVRIELDADPLRKTRYPFPRPKTLKALELRLVGMEGKQVGLAEVEVW
jgi:hypothetical protein